MMAMCTIPGTKVSVHVSTTYLGTGRGYKEKRGGNEEVTKCRVVLHWTCAACWFWD